MKAISTIGFIGGGRISQLLLKSLKNKNVLPNKVLIADPNSENLTRVESISPEHIESSKDNREASDADVIFLAVHPPIVRQVAEEIKGRLPDDCIVVSFVPTVSMQKLSELLGGFSRSVRMIPNAPSMIHQGYNPVVFHTSIPADEKKKLLHFFYHWGETPEVEEKTLEAYAVLTGMGPTYFWFQWLELHRLGKEFGLSDLELTNALPAMLHGAIDTLFQSGLSPSEALDLIPAYPMKKHESAISDIFRNTLTPLFQRLSSNDQ